MVDEQITYVNTPHKNVLLQVDRLRQVKTSNILITVNNKDLKL